MSPRSPRNGFRSKVLSVVGLAAMATVFGCGGGGGGGGAVNPPAGGGGSATLPPPTTIQLTRQQDLPGMNVMVESVSGGTGTSGRFMVGDHVAVTFRLQNDLGAAIPISELNSGNIIVSGPTNDYQPLLARRTDLRTASVDNGDGTYTYTFTAAIPSVYPAPLNDSALIGAADGERQGQAILSGTYAVGMEARKDYLVENSSFRDVGNAVAYFLIGSATTIEPREVVTMANCNACHVQLRAHGENRRDVAYCVTCHTIGAEDRNTNGATPGVTIHFATLIHKLHNASHLPSVLGVATNTNGSRNYAATPRPLEYAGFSGVPEDFSHITSPIWPNFSNPMPRDLGYTALGTTEKALDDEIRRGLTLCDKCHGDPDGSGPLPAPAQGDRAYTHPTRAACGACHDDIDWNNPYSANLTTMPPQPDDDSCVFCHTPDGPNGIPTESSHRHPLIDPSFNPGLNLTINSVSEAGVNDGSGTIEPNEKIAVNFSITDDAGQAVAASSLLRVDAIVSGPLSNRNLLLFGQIPLGALGAGPSYTMNLAEVINLDYVNDSTAVLGDTFQVSRTPVWDVTGATITVQVATPAGAQTMLQFPAAAGQNYIDVVDGSMFVRNDYIVIDTATPASKEYLRIQTVDGNRLWFNSQAATTYQPALRRMHGMGAPVDRVTLANLTRNTNYSINTTTGVITELTEFGAGKGVLVTYTSDFVVPMTYPTALNSTPDVDDRIGKWEGKSLVEGTYTVAMWTQRNLSLALQGETNTYRLTSESDSKSFQLGVGSPVETYSLISSAENCNACHEQLLFHGGGRRGFDTCILCHGSVGSEDRSQYVAPNAPATTGTLIEFRNMLHKIHKGAELDDPAAFEVVGFGSGAYPNNFGVSTYEDVGFPAMPGGTMNCVKCHGTNNMAWLEPSDRSHPSEQFSPIQVWRPVCGSCHDSSAAQAHIDVKTSGGGAESCAVCHGQGRPEEVDLVHKVR